METRYWRGRLMHETRPGKIEPCDHVMFFGYGYSKAGRISHQTSLKWPLVFLCDGQDLARSLPCSCLASACESVNLSSCSKTSGMSWMSWKEVPQKVLGWFPMVTGLLGGLEVYWAQKVTSMMLWKPWVSHL